MKNNYNKRIWLNPENSAATGSVVCHDGVIISHGKKLEWKYLEIADCYNKVRLHKTEDDTDCDFISKLEKLRNTISDFIDFLKKKEKSKEEHK